MAETGRLRAMEVFWTRDESDVDLSLVHVPGVQDPGNRRPSRPEKVKGRKTREVKPAVPVTRRPVSESVIPSKAKSGTHKPHKESTSKPEDHYKPSLKDLCAEDKQRVANLINELARVGEEKNKVAQELNSERIQFEERMKNILTQQERVLQERQAVQQQLWECQNLLGRYQRIVSDQQDALNEQVCESLQESPRDDSLVDAAPPPPKQADRRQHRQPPSDGASQKRASAVRPHEVPRLPLAGDDAKGSRSSTPSGEVSANSTPRADQDLTPRGTRRARVPSLAGGDRPFTAYIDGLIASEQSGSAPEAAPRAEERRSNRSGDGSSQATSRGKTSSVGPLHEPVLSSTHQSDSLSISQQSRTKAGEFRPLLPDSSPRSSLLSGATHPLDEFSYPTESQEPSQTHYGGGRPYPDHLQYPQNSHPGGGFPQPPPGSRVTFHEQLHQSSPPGPRHPVHQLSDDDFVNYYKAMTPDERRRHLMTQKAALLAEQQRLRQILEDQEQLLHSKQRQLHLQQQVQQQRLEHFEQTGVFPPEPTPGQINALHPVHLQPPEGPGVSFYSDQPHPSDLPRGHDLLQADYQYIPPGPQSLLPQHDPYIQSHPHIQPLTRPPMLGHEDNPYRLRDNTHQAAYRGLHADRDRVSITLAQSGTEADTTYPGPEPPGNENEISKEEIDAVSESFENMLFLQRHGIDVSNMRNQHDRKASRPIGTSPTRAVGVSSGRPASRPRVETMEDLLNDPRDSSADTVEGNRKKVARKTSKIRSSPQQINNFEHAARLLDLVDEVESCSRHPVSSSQGRHPTPPGSRPPRFDGALEDLQPAVNEAEGEEEDLEESRILEEVFFVM